MALLVMISWPFILKKKCQNWYLETLHSKNANFESYFSDKLNNQPIANVNDLNTNGLNSRNYPNETAYIA